MVHTSVFIVLFAALVASLMLSFLIDNEMAGNIFGTIAIVGILVFVMLAFIATNSIEVTPVDKPQYEVAASKNYRVLVYRGRQARLVKSRVVMEDLDRRDVNMFIVEKKSLVKLYLTRQFFYTTDSLSVVRDLDGEIASDRIAKRVKLAERP